MAERCPECGSSLLYKDGLRYTTEGQVQRYLCRTCSYRFSESNVKIHITRKVSKTLDPIDNSHKGRIVSSNRTVQESANGFSFLLSEDVGSHNLSSVAKGLNALPLYSSNAKYASKKAKNLTTTELEKSVGEQTTKTLDQQTAKGLLLQYTWYLQKEGYGENSRYIDCIRMLANAGANLQDPEHVKEVIAKKDWKNGTKMQACYAYDALTKMLKLTWTMPTYKQEETLPFIPTMKEIDALISGARSHRLAGYLQTLKETYADPTEAVRLRWIDINENTVTINRPVKNHNPRRIPVSNQLLAMLNMLPKTSEYIFNTTYTRISDSFQNIRRKVAQNLQNPRILSITLRTFRHFGATMLYAQTRDILLVKKLLGHKKIENTLKYTQLIQFKDDEYEAATATDLDEAKKLIGAGFEFVTDMNSIKLFRKPKRYVG